MQYKGRGKFDDLQARWRVSDEKISRVQERGLTRYSSGRARRKPAGRCPCFIAFCGTVFVYIQASEVPLIGNTSFRGQSLESEQERMDGGEEARRKRLMELYPAVERLHASRIPYDHRFGIILTVRPPRKYVSLIRSSGYKRLARDLTFGIHQNFKVQRSTFKYSKSDRCFHFHFSRTHWPRVQ